MRLTVPGNLLLMGEYAITLPEMHGIALAIEPSVIFEIEPTEVCTLTGVFEDQKYSWQPEKKETAPSPLLTYLFEAFPVTPPWHIHIDTSSFAYPDGRKKGFGSSAAVVVGLTFLLLYYKLGRKPHLLEEVFPKALNIHRSFQGGRGSGYDVLASLVGGVGLFTGGPLPKWKPLDPKILPQLVLKKGEKSCSTKEALEKFEQTSAKKPIKIKQYTTLSNRLVNRFASNPSKNDFKRAILLNRWLHHQLEIGISWDDDWIKPLGAGSELGIAWNIDEKESHLKIATEGLRWTP